MIKNKLSLFIATFLIIGFFFLALPEKLSAQELVCEEVNGLMWCYNDQACGQPCNDVCAAGGLVPIADNTVWFEAQNTEEKCIAISEAFGLGNTVMIDPFTFACLEDKFGNHTVGGGLIAPLACSNFNECPEMHRTRIDNQVPCGPDSQRSICPCEPPPPPNVPTLSEWGLIAMAGILGIVGYLVMRRRKATA